MRTETPPTIRLGDYRPPAYLIDNVELDFALDPARTEVRSKLHMRPNPDAGAAQPLVLDGEQLELLGVSVNGEPVAASGYSVTESALTLSNMPAVPFTLEIHTVCNPDGNTALSGLYRSSGNYCTQCEAEGFRRITYFLDRPDVLARYRVRIEADQKTVPVLLANGNPVENGNCGNGRHFAVWDDPHPKPSYLFALVSGDLAEVSDRFTTMDGRDVALKIFVEHGKEDRCDWAMQSLKASMTWDEQVFGRVYDLDIFMIVAVSDFNMGAMENKGLNVFNDKYILARPDTATDQDYANIEAIIAHEYFHNWSGNRVTCRDWFQLCLKEGLTVFRDQEFTSDLRSRAVKRITDVRTLRAHQFPEDAGPLAHPVRPDAYIEINNFYTATVYEKGAEVVRMIKTLIGAEAFARGMTNYFDRHDGEAATVEDFVAALADASGRDLSQFFRWYEIAGTPEIVASGTWHRQQHTYVLSLTQSIPDTPGQKAKPPHLVPLALGLVGPDGKDLPLELEDEGVLDTPVIELATRSRTLRFRNISQCPVPSINRGFSAPVKLTTNLERPDLLFLLAHDSDTFNRWEAGQQLGRAFVLDAVKDRLNDADIDGYCKSLGAVLADDTLEPAFQALMLVLPGETDIAGAIGKDVDPLKIHRARNAVRAGLGRGLIMALERICARSDHGARYMPDAASAGRRALLFAALSLIAAANPASGARQALNIFRAAGNMTEKAGALTILAAHDVPQRHEALEAFHDAHKDDSLVVDKWLSFHAQLPSETAPADVARLMDHPAFTLKRPNTVRSLVGSLASLNPVGFNASDGSGYRLVADVVTELDRLNPQTAARMAAAFKSWRSLESIRRGQAETALKSIADVPGLSRDTLEIVTKTLG